MSEQLPPIPETKDATIRNNWIIEHAQYFSITRRIKRRYFRAEKPNLSDAIALAKKNIEREPDSRFLIYAVYGISDALAATVTSQGVKYPV